MVNFGTATSHSDTYHTGRKKYEEATTALIEMEMRAIMEEYMLEATLQEQHNQVSHPPK